MQVADHGNAEVFVDAQQRVHHDPGVAGIERSNRLVGEDDVGFLNQRPRNRHALLLAAGELVGALRRERGHIELFQGRDRQRLVLLGPKLRQRPPGRDFGEPPHQDVSQHVEPANQIELLKNHRRPCAPLPQLVAAQSRNIDALVKDPAFGWLSEAVDHPQQRRLAGAGSADHADKAAGSDRERCVVDRGFRTEPARQTFHHQHAMLQTRNRKPSLTPRLDSCVTTAAVRAIVHTSCGCHASVTMPSSSPSMTCKLLGPVCIAHESSHGRQSAFR